jgi:hypothetical protein
MKLLLLLVCIATTFAAETTTDWPTGNRTTPPTINSVSPLGVPRGGTVELTVDGLNLAKASAVFFSQAGLKRAFCASRNCPI